MIFDENRGMRKTESPKKIPLNSNHLLLKLAAGNVNFRNVDISYYTPNKRKLIPSAISKINIINEMKGTFHTKFLVFDNNIILTGANLSEEYFLNRKDRYLLINNCSELADYLQDVLECFAEAGTRYDNASFLKGNPTKYEKNLDHLKDYYSIKGIEINPNVIN
jgi:CDP-diacylglycerol--glycerol-3-phosphate 3-phosphatidyltransferase